MGTTSRAQPGSTLFAHSPTMTYSCAGLKQPLPPSRAHAAFSFSTTRKRLHLHLAIKCPIQSRRRKRNSLRRMLCKLGLDLCSLEGKSQVIPKLWGCSQTLTLSCDGTFCLGHKTLYPAVLSTFLCLWASTFSSFD